MILAKYLASRAHVDGGVAGAVAAGVKDYFEHALPSLLLYKAERPQFDETAALDALFCDQYGIEHLLRLFSLWPDVEF